MRRFVYDPGLPPPPPYASILFCGVCGHEIHRSWPDDGLTPDLRAEGAEESSVAHMREAHGWRYRLWERTKWGWLMRGIREWDPPK